MIEYIPILIIIIFSFILSTVIVGASYLLALNSGTAENVSVYESGFDPVGDSSQNFGVSFFLVAIVFIIFDLEVSFLFPWTAIWADLQMLGFWTMMVFILILGVGLIYEYLNGGLEWE